MKVIVYGRIPFRRRSVGLNNIHTKTIGFRTIVESDSCIPVGRVFHHSLLISFRTVKKK